MKRANFLKNKHTQLENAHIKEPFVGQFWSKGQENPIYVIKKIDGEICWLNSATRTSVAMQVTKEKLLAEYQEFEHKHVKNFKKPI